MTTRRFTLLVILVVLLLMLFGAGAVYFLVGRSAAPGPTSPEPLASMEATRTATRPPVGPQLPTSSGNLLETASPEPGPTATNPPPADSPTTVPPSATMTTTPPPALCSLLDLRFISVTSTVARWRLENRGSQAMEIARIETSWPQSNDAIFNAYLDGKVIWSGEDLVPPTIMATWVGEPEDRQLRGVVSLEFFYGTQAATSGYSIKVQFTNGCEVAATK